MTFDVAADSYGRFMGRFSEPLAEVFLEQVGLADVDGVLDVGCGPGILTERLVAAFGPDRVAAVDPSPSFVEAARARCPGVEVRRATAEDLPYDDAAFDAALAQLVVHFMTDPVAGLREMGRVVRPGGIVAANVWDFAGDAAPLSLFWRTVLELDPGAQTESHLAGVRRGHLVELAEEAGLGDAIEGYLTVVVPFASFDDWWEPYTLGVGPAGAYVTGLDADARDRLRDRLREQLPEGPFEISASAWSMVARA
jgi:SAM-dependent methyltransferase